MKKLHDAIYSVLSCSTDTANALAIINSHFNFLPEECKDKPVEFLRKIRQHGANLEKQAEFTTEIFSKFECHQNSNQCNCFDKQFMFSVLIEI